MQTRDVAIIGGGLTGLVTAFWLRKKGIDAFIAEKSSTAGGVIMTVSEKGFVYETGPNTGVISHPEVVELFDELQGICQLEPANREAKRRLIWKKGSWHPLPSGLMEAIQTPLFSTGDKLRILLEPFRKKGRDPLESLESMVKRRLGRSFLDYAVDPFISGIYAGDPAYLVPRYALPKLYALEQEYGSFIRGAVMKTLKRKDDSEKKVTKEVFSVYGGLGNLVAALESVTGPENILKGVEDLVVTPFNSGYRLNGTINGEETDIRSRYVVSTAGPFEFETLFPFLDKEELSELNTLRYAGIIQITMGFRKWDGMELNAFGGLVPSKERRDILGILFPSSFLSNRAPEGGALLAVFMGGARNPDMINFPDEDLIRIALKETQVMMKTGSREPDLLRLFRYRHAIPQYGKSTMKRLEAISRIHSRYGGLLLAGNIHEGIGMSDRIRQGKRIADHIARAF